METDGKRIALMAVGVLLALMGAFWLWWPFGVACGLVVGVAATVLVVRAMQDADRDPHDGSMELLFEDA